MATAPVSRKLNLTRDQLAQFLTDQQQIRQFELLFTVADAAQYIPDELVEVNIVSGNAQATANDALAQINALAKDTELTSLAPRAELGTIAPQNSDNVNITGGLISGLDAPLAVASGGIGVTTAASNVVFAGPTAGAAAAPTFRSLVGADIPALTSGSSILYGNGSGGFSNVSIGSGVSFAGGILSATGTGGTVTSVTGTSPVVSSGGTTPAISLAANYGDTQNPYASKTANFVLAAPNGSSGAPTFRAVVAADIPTLNQNTTGSAATLTTGRTIAITGDLAYTSPSFNGSTNVTAAGTLATVNANVGSFTYANITVNGKGLITAASNGTAPVTSVSATAPVASSGGTTPTISMAAATTSVNGYLTSTDWTTFNAKQAALVSGTNIKTVNSNSLLGAGDVSVGTVTSVATGTGLTGGPITSSGTINFAVAAVGTWAATPSSANLAAAMTDETGSGSLVFATRPTFASTLGVGAATASASGAGISFPATQSASTDPNTLDDYEEAAWTPTLTGIIFVGAQTNEYNYIKVGRLVHVSIYMSAATSVTIGNFSTITLPFNNAGTTTATGRVVSANTGFACDFVVFNNQITFINGAAASAGFTLSFTYRAIA